MTYFESYSEFLVIDFIFVGIDKYIIAKAVTYFTSICWFETVFPLDFSLYPTIIASALCLEARSDLTK